jgi:hypothetical protein
VNAAGTGCERECESDSQCPGSQVCSNYTCREPPCTATSCGSGFVCSQASGTCVLDVGSPPAGSPQSCSNIPAWHCNGTEATCGQLEVFNPRLGDGYWDYPLNGETEQNQYRSFARRDMISLIKYASASVRCLAESWTFGNGGPLGLGDMSEANGAIPGTAVGYPGHPPGTHVNGYDMDIAYYQVNTADNKLRSVCPHTINGQDQHRCTGEPTVFDVWRSAAFIAKLHDTPQLRVIGVDGYIGPKVISAISQLCSSGWLSGNACTKPLKLAYETTNTGAGWYHHHHHHLHVSLKTRASTTFSLPVSAPDDDGMSACLTPGCAPTPLSIDPRRSLYRPLKMPLAY